MSLKLFQIVLEEDELNIDKYFEIKDKEQNEGEDNPQLLNEQKKLNETVTNEIKENAKNGIDAMSDDSSSSSDTDDSSSDGLDDDLDFGDEDDTAVDSDIKEKSEDEKTEESEELADSADPSVESAIVLNPYQQELLLTSKVNKIKEEISFVLADFSTKKEAFNVLVGKVSRYVSESDYASYGNNTFVNSLPSYMNLANNMLTDKSADPVINLSILRDNYISVFANSKRLFEYSMDALLYNVVSENAKYQNYDVSVAKNILGNDSETICYRDMLPGGYRLCYVIDNVFKPNIIMTKTDLADPDSLSVDMPYTEEMKTIAKILSYINGTVVENLDNVSSQFSSLLNMADKYENNKAMYIKMYVTYFRNLLRFYKTYTTYLQVKTTEATEFFNQFTKQLEYTKQREQPEEDEVDD